jgi:hypothetical protein
MTRLEALAYGVMQAEGFTPGSRSWRNNNPGNLRYAPSQIDSEENFAIFRTFADGWEALINQWWLYCSGRTKNGLGPKSTLAEAIRKYADLQWGLEFDNYLHTIMKWSPTDGETTLSYFLEDLPK